MLVAFYGLVLMVYAVVSLMLNPILSPYSCELFKEMELRTPLVLTFGWLQNTACIMVLLLESMLVYGPATSKKKHLLGLVDGLRVLCFCFNAIFTSNTKYYQ